MDSGEQGLRDTTGERREKLGILAVLFEVVEHRLQEAAEAQLKNNDVSFFAIEELDRQRYYVVTLARSYEDLVSASAEADIIDIMIPAPDADTEQPTVRLDPKDQAAMFLLRKRRSPDLADFLIIRPDRIDHYAADDTVSQTSFFSPEKTIDERPLDLMMRIDGYEMIPANVRPRRALIGGVDLLLDIDDEPA